MDRSEFLSWEFELINLLFHSLLLPFFDLHDILMIIHSCWTNIWSSHFHQWQCFTCQHHSSVVVFVVFTLILFFFSCDFVVEQGEGMTACDKLCIREGSDSLRIKLRLHIWAGPSFLSLPLFPRFCSPGPFTERTRLKGSVFSLVLKYPRGGNGPRLEVVQDQGNPWRGRSKLLSALRLAKIHLIESSSMSYVSAIKLIRTDTTLDLSQKAEKRCLKNATVPLFYRILYQKSLWAKYSDGWYFWSVNFCIAPRSWGRAVNVVATAITTDARSYTASASRAGSCDRRRNFACSPSSELVCHTEVAAWKTFIQGLGQGRVDRRTHHPDHIQLTNTSSKIVAANHLYLAMPGGFLVTIVEWLPPRCTLGDLLLMKGVSAPHSCWPVISMPGNGLARCTLCKYVYLWPVTSVHLSSPAPYSLSTLCGVFLYINFHLR